MQELLPDLIHDIIFHTYNDILFEFRYELAYRFDRNASYSYIK